MQNLKLIGSSFLSMKLTTSYGAVIERVKSVNIRIDADTKGPVAVIEVDDHFSNEGIEKFDGLDVDITNVKIKIVTSRP